MNEEPVYFDNNKGQRLIGMRHVPKGRPPYPTVIIFHGLTGNKAEVHFKYTRLARLLCEHGFQVYRFDFRGHGDSWGNFSQIIMDDLVKDTKDIFNFVRQQKSTDRTRMGVVSLSLCPGLYIRLTSKDVKAMVLHSPAAYPKTTVERGWGIGVRYGRSGPSSLVYNPNFWKSLDKYNAFTSITYADMPIILICGDEDDVVWVDEVRELYKAANQPKKLVVIKYADHSFLREEHERRVNRETLAWMKKYV